MYKKNVNLINGETYYYLEKGNSENIIILLHGNLTSSKIFESLFNRLSKSYRVIAPDMRGFGDSTYFRRINSIKDFATDILFFMKALNIENANIVGWSLGGAVAMNLAAKDQSKINNLILVNSMPHDGIPKFKHNEKGTEVVGDVYESRDDFLNDKFLISPLIEAVENRNHVFIIKYLKERNFTTEIIAEDLINEIYKQRNLIDVYWALANFNMSHEHNFYSPGTNTINNIQSNTLHIWGEDDKVVPEYMVIKNVNALYKTSTYKKYPNVGHCPMIDASEDLCNDIINHIEKNK